MRGRRPEPVITGEQKEKAEVEIVEQSKRIEFYITEYSIELLANKMHKNEFFVPPYQREFTWEPERKSRFIESVVMGLPIPFLFFWEMEDGRLEIVDGSQRLRTRGICARRPPLIGTRIAAFYVRMSLLRSPRISATENSKSLDPGHRAQRAC